MKATSGARPKARAATKAKSGAKQKTKAATKARSGPKKKARAATAAKKPRPVALEQALPRPVRRSGQVAQAAAGPAHGPGEGARPAPSKIDPARSLRELYTATEEIKDVVAGPGVFLAVEGQGAPGGAAFQAAINALYGAAYTIKFTLKKAGGVDFGVGKLECLWDVQDYRTTPLEEWRWQLMIRVPEEVKASDVAEAAARLEEKGTDATRVRRIRFEHGRCLQTLHVGPYERVSETYARLGRAAEELGLIPWSGLEVYVSDPRRVSPEQLRTIVRLAVRPA